MFLRWLKDAESPGGHLKLTIRLKWPGKALTITANLLATTFCPCLIYQPITQFPPKISNLIYLKTALITLISIYPQMQALQKSIFLLKTVQNPINELKTGWKIFYLLVAFLLLNIKNATSQSTVQPCSKKLSWASKCYTLNFKKNGI